VTDVDHLRDLVVDRLAARPEVAACETSVIFLSFRQSILPRYAQSLPPEESKKKSNLTVRQGVTKFGSN
jgi:hypothetical protein